MHVPPLAAWIQIAGPGVPHAEAAEEARQEAGAHAIIQSSVFEALTTTDVELRMAKQLHKDVA